MQKQYRKRNSELISYRLAEARKAIRRSRKIIDTSYSISIAVLPPAGLLGVFFGISTWRMPLSSRSIIVARRWSFAWRNSIFLENPYTDLQRWLHTETSLSSLTRRTLALLVLLFPLLVAALSSKIKVHEGWILTLVANPRNPYKIKVMCAIIWL